MADNKHRQIHADCLAWLQEVQENNGLVKGAIAPVPPPAALLGFLQQTKLHAHVQIQGDSWVCHMLRAILESGVGPTGSMFEGLLTIDSVGLKVPAKGKRIPVTGYTLLVAAWCSKACPRVLEGFRFDTSGTSVWSPRHMTKATYLDLFNFMNVKNMARDGQLRPISGAEPPIKTIEQLYTWLGPDAATLVVELKGNVPESLRRMLQSGRAKDTFVALLGQLLKYPDIHLEVKLDPVLADCAAALHVTTENSLLCVALYDDLAAEGSEVHFGDADKSMPLPEVGHGSADDIDLGHVEVYIAQLCRNDSVDMRRPRISLRAFLDAALQGVKIGGRRIPFGALTIRLVCSPELHELLSQPRVKQALSRAVFETLSHEFAQVVLAADPEMPEPDTNTIGDLINALFASDPRCPNLSSDYTDEGEEPDRATANVGNGDLESALRGLVAVGCLSARFEVTHHPGLSDMADDPAFKATFHELVFGKKALEWATYDMEPGSPDQPKLPDQLRDLVRCMVHEATGVLLPADASAGPKRKRGKLSSEIERLGDEREACAKRRRELEEALEQAERNLEATKKALAAVNFSLEQLS